MISEPIRVTSAPSLPDSIGYPPSGRARDRSSAIRVPPTGCPATPYSPHTRRVRHSPGDRMGGAALCSPVGPRDLRGERPPPQTYPDPAAFLDLAPRRWFSGTSTGRRKDLAAPGGLCPGVPGPITSFAQRDDPHARAGSLITVIERREPGRKFALGRDHAGPPTTLATGRSRVSGCAAWPTRVGNL